MEAIVQALLVWIAVNSNYSTEDIPLPEVKFVTPQQITIEYYDDRPDLIPDSGIDDRIWALYDATYHAHGAIFLRIDSNDSGTTGSTNTQLISSRDDIAITAALTETLGLTTAAERSAQQHDWQVELLENDPILTERLIHELVHHVQYQSGEAETYQCPAQGEKEAYRLGGRYFKQRYHDDPMPNRNFWGHIYSRC